MDVDTTPPFPCVGQTIRVVESFDNGRIIPNYGADDVQPRGPPHHYTKAMRSPHIVRECD